MRALELSLGRTDAQPFPKHDMQNIASAPLPISVPQNFTNSFSASLQSSRDWRQHPPRVENKIMQMLKSRRIEKTDSRSVGRPKNSHYISRAQLLSLDRLTLTPCSSDRWQRNFSFETIVKRFEWKSKKGKSAKSRAIAWHEGKSVSTV